MIPSICTTQCSQGRPGLGPCPRSPFDPWSRPHRRPPAGTRRMVLRLMGGGLRDADHGLNPTLVVAEQRVLRQSTASATSSRQRPGSVRARTMAVLQVPISAGTWVASSSQTSVYRHRIKDPWAVSPSRVQSDTQSPPDTSATSPICLQFSARRRSRREALAPTEDERKIGASTLRLLLAHKRSRQAGGAEVFGAATRQERHSRSPRRSA